MSQPAPDEQPMAWRSPWAMVVGFFMILVDSTIVTVATPTIMRELGADVTSVVWVTSAYLLAYVASLLTTGRLGDWLGLKLAYLTGLVAFTPAPLGCGLTTTIELLIAARVVQGLGAALMTLQTMTAITRVSSPHQCGTIMAVWGVTAGSAILVGPVLGGLLTGLLGWEWVSFINIPIGVAGYVAARRLASDLEQYPHRLDWPGVTLSGTGLFYIVFGLQEASTHDWGVITGPISVGLLLVVGVRFLAAFVVWQRFNPNEPLTLLKLFGDRNFSVANLAIVLVEMTSVVTPYPLMVWAQQARGLSPPFAALVNAPSVVVMLIVAKWNGQLVNRVHLRYLTATGGLAWAPLLLAVGHFLDTTTPVWVSVVLLTSIGVANSLVFGPLSTAATTNLPITYAGAGSGVYSATRQVGSVLGSAVVATVMSILLVISPQTPGDIVSAASGMLLLSAALILAVGAVACFLERPKHQRKN